MSSIDLITSLPACLSCSVLCEWVRLKSLARLDSAFCNRNSRSLFLELMRCRECVSGDKVHMSTPRLLEWLLARELKVSRMIVDCAHAQITKYLLLNATAFQELDLFGEVFHYVPNLKFTNLIALTCPLRLQYCALMANFPKLRKLEVYLYPGSGDNINFGSGILFDLDKLYVGCRSQLPDGSILSVVRIARSLRHLSLHPTQHTICNTEWVNIATCCPQLLTLESWIHDLTDETLGELCRLCPHITTLYIGFSNLITDVGVLFITQRLHQLQSLTLLECQQVTDLSLVHIETHCNKLSTLSLVLSPLVNPSALVELQGRLQQKHTV